MVDPKQRAWRALANLASIPPPVVDAGTSAWASWQAAQLNRFEDNAIALEGNAQIPTAGDSVQWSTMFGNLPLFGSYWYDARLEIYHVRHRAYDPELGRWLQRDPIGYAGGDNLYGYVGEMPMGGVDPMGLDTYWLGDRLRDAGFDGLGDFADRVADGLDSGAGVGAAANLIDAYGEMARQNRQRDNRDLGGSHFDDYVDQAMMSDNARRSDFYDASREVGKTLELALRTASEVGDTADAIANAVESVHRDSSLRNVGASAGTIVLAMLPGPSPKGQVHHAISMKIGRALDEHPTLKGKFGSRDSRLTTQAKDDASHRGYQKWHRDYDQEVVDWLRAHPNATEQEFNAYLQSIYDAQAMRDRFPDGLDKCKGASP